MLKSLVWKFKLNWLLKFNSRAHTKQVVDFNAILCSEVVFRQFFCLNIILRHLLLFKFLLAFLKIDVLFQVIIDLIILEIFVLIWLTTNLFICYYLNRIQFELLTVFFRRRKELQRVFTRLGLFILFLKIIFNFLWRSWSMRFGVQAKINNLNLFSAVESLLNFGMGLTDIDAIFLGSIIKNQTLRLLFWE